jgi:hypothetical protein
MKRYPILMVPLFLIMVVLVLVTGQAQADPQFPLSQLTMTICVREAPAEMWFNQRTSHGRNMLQHWVMASSDPRFVGSGYDVVNWNINYVSMKGVSWGHYELRNSNGTDGWMGDWQGKLSPSNPPIVGADGMTIWLFEGRGQGQGFGEYEGLHEHFDVHQKVTVYPSTEDALEEVPCVTGTTIDGQVFVMQNIIPAYVTGSTE